MHRKEILRESRNTTKFNVATTGMGKFKWMGDKSKNHFKIVENSRPRGNDLTWIRKNIETNSDKVLNYLPESGSTNDSSLCSLTDSRNRSFHCRNSTVDRRSCRFHPSYVPTDCRDSVTDCGSSVVDLRNKKFNRSKSLESYCERETLCRGKNTSSCRSRKCDILPENAEYNKMSFYTSFSFDNLSSNGPKQENKVICQRCHRKQKNRGKSLIENMKNSKLNTNRFEKEENCHKKEGKCSETFNRELESTSNLNTEKFFGKNFDFIEREPQKTFFSPFKTKFQVMPKKNKGFQRQICSSASVSLSVLACGFAAYVPWSQYVKVFVSHHFHEVIKYIFILGAATGVLASAFLSRAGHKLPIFLSMSVLLLGWTSVIFIVESWLLLLFAGIAGFCTSLCCILSQNYATQISAQNRRGAVATLPTVAFHIGLLLSMLLSNFCIWKIFSIFGTALIAPFFLSFFSFRESPRFTILNDEVEAFKTLLWLRGSSEEVGENSSKYKMLREMTISSSISDKDLNMPSFNDFYPYNESETILKEFDKILINASRNFSPFQKREYFSSAFWKPFLICSILSILSNFSGIYCVAFFCKGQYAQNFGIDSNISYIIILLIILSGLVIFFLLSDQIGRKLLLLLGLTLMAASCYGLGLFIFLEDIHKIEKFSMYYRVAELFCIVVFVLAYGASIIPVTSLTITESLTTRFKWLGIVISLLICLASFLLVDKVQTHLEPIFTLGGLFWFHCIVTVAGYIFVLIFFTELKHYQLEDVEAVFLTKNNNIFDTFISKA